MLITYNIQMTTPSGAVVLLTAGYGGQPKRYYGWTEASDALQRMRNNPHNERCTFDIVRQNTEHT